MVAAQKVAVAVWRPSTTADAEPPWICRWSYSISSGSSNTGLRLDLLSPLLFISSSIYLSQFSLSFFRARLQEPRWRRGREVVRSTANQDLGFSLSPPGLQ
jgi:hypothetical protein